MPRIDYARPEYTVAKLTQILIDLGYAPESLAGLSKIELVQAIEEDSEDDVDLNNAELEEDDMPVEIEDKTPRRGTPEWHDYVMSQFNDDERAYYSGKDGKGIEAVKADGLRRVGELVLGEVISSRPIDNVFGFDSKGLPYASVRYEIEIMTKSGLKRYGALADVNYLNTEDMFLGFASATAETRAKGRAWREALGVKTYAIEEFAGKKNVEEMVKQTTSEWNGDDELEMHQAKTIAKMCKNLNICVHSLLNMNKDYKYLGKVEYFTGLDDERLKKKNGNNLIGILNKMQQGTIQIDESLKVKEAN